MNFRSDIQGLRGIAVLGVLLFHFGVPFFSGGFVGVDIFFVISGFLITGKIIGSIYENSFSYWQFLRGRFFRLFPALFVTIFVSLFFAYFVFSKPLFLDSSFEALSAIFSVSNFLFWSQSGYFDSDAVTKLFLHTWSLSVEDQFYFFWPLLLCFLVLKSNNLFFWILIVFFLSLCSLGFAQFYDSSLAFFLTPFRVWEFCLGAIAFFCVARKKYLIPDGLLSDFSILSSLAALFFCFVFYDEGTVFPGYAALFPCLSVFFILTSGDCILKSYFLENPILNFVGLISYSLYLTHWPIVVFYHYFFDDYGFLFKLLFCSSLCLILSLVLYFFVEQRFRYSYSNFNFHSALFVLSLICLFFLYFQYSGKETSKNDLVEFIYNAKNNRSIMISDFKLSPGHEIDKRKSIAVIGDSLGDDIYAALVASYPDFSFTRMTFNGCRPLHNYVDNEQPPHVRRRCSSYTEKTFSELKLRSHSFSAVVIDSNWTELSISHLPETVSYLKGLGLSVYVVEPRIRISGGALGIAEKSSDITEFKLLSSQNSEVERSRDFLKFIKSQSDVSIIPFLDFQCSSDFICSNLIDGKFPIIYDNVHMTVQANKLYSAWLGVNHLNLFSSLSKGTNFYVDDRILGDNILSKISSGSVDRELLFKNFLVKPSADILIVGDSFSEDLFSVFSLAFPQLPLNNFISRSCLPFFDISNKRWSAKRSSFCSQFSSDFLNVIANNISLKFVFIDARWGRFDDGAILETATEILNSGIIPIYLHPRPRFGKASLEKFSPDYPVVGFNKLFSSGVKPAAIKHFPAEELVSLGAGVFDIRGLYCYEKVVCNFLLNEDVPVSYDGSFFTADAIRFISNSLVYHDPGYGKGYADEVSDSESLISFLQSTGLLTLRQP